MRGLKYDIDGIAKLVMFIIRIPNNAKPRSISIDIILSFMNQNYLSFKNIKKPYDR